MAANHFEIDGQRVDSFDEFLDLERNNCWSKVLYFPDSFEPNGRKPLMFFKKTFQEVSFKDTDIKNARFIRCMFEKCLFLGAEIDNCEFIDCSFKSTNTNKIRIKNTLLDPSDFEQNFDFLKDTNIAIQLFHALFKNSMEQHQPQYAIESLYQMKHAEKCHLKSQRDRGLISGMEYWAPTIGYHLHNFVSGYGLRPWRVVRLVGLVLTVFTFFNYLIRHHVFPPDTVTTLIDAFYFTCVTVTTLGYGDITPATQLGRIVVVTEAFAGFGTISLLLAAIVSIAIRAR